jgi:dienelactone hydrolase
MADVLLFHHAQGLTEGVREFAEQLRAAGHRTTVPDLYDGATFAALAGGVGHAEQVGSATIIERGRLAAEGLPNDADEWFVADGDLDAARDLAGTVEGAELFLYPGDQHLFTDNSLPAYDESAATLLLKRVLSFLDEIE